MMHSTGIPGVDRRRRKVAIAIVAAVAILAGTGVAQAVTSPPVAGLMVSTDAGHSQNVKRLSGASLAVGEHLFIGGSTSSITSVSYYLDDAVGSGAPITTAVSPFDVGLVSTIAAGRHNLLADVTLSSGRHHDLFARFAIGPVAATTVPTATTVAPVALTTVAATPVTSTTGTSGSAALINNWGTPKTQYDFNDTTGWNVYDNGTKVDYGLKEQTDVSTTGGILTIKATSDGHTGGLASSDLLQYGRWETRMKATGDGTCWRPVLLLWGSDNTTTDQGEIDYAENAGGGLKSTNFFLHYPGGPQVSANMGVDQTQWHNYAVDWSATKLTGYVDGKLFFTETDPSKIPKGVFGATIQLDSMAQSSLCNGNTQMSVDWMKIYPAGA